VISSAGVTTASENDAFDKQEKEATATINDELNGESTINSHYEFEDEKKEEHEAIISLVRFSPPQFDVNGPDPVVNSVLVQQNLKSTDRIEPSHTGNDDEEIAISWRIQELYSPVNLNGDSTSKYIRSKIPPLSKLEPLSYENEGEDENKKELELSARQFSPLQLFEEPCRKVFTTPPHGGTESKLLCNSLQKPTKERNGVVKKIEHGDHTMGLVNKAQPHLGEHPTVSSTDRPGPTTVSSSGDPTSRAKSKLLSIVQERHIAKQEEAKLRKAKVQARKLLTHEVRVQNGKDSTGSEDKREKNAEL
jgi:hypothetical protein